MPEIEERIAEFLNEKLAPVPAAQSVLSGFLVRLSAAAVALVVVVERAAVHVASWLKKLLTYRSAAATSSARTALRQELADHLRDAYDHQLELGRNRDEAWEHVTSHFGDYEAILGELEELHQPTPMWEIVTRVLALPLALWLMESVWHNSYVSLWIQDFVILVCFMALLIAAPLAAWRPRGGWRRLTPALGLGVLIYTFHAEGFSLPECLTAGLLTLALAALGRPFSSPHFATRMRALMQAATAGTLVLCTRLFLVNLETLNPARIGSGVAVSFIFAIWGIYLGRPAWPVLLLMIAWCHGMVFTILHALASPAQAALPLTFNQVLLMTPLYCTCLAFLVGWTFFNRRAYACWLPAISVVAMILTYITRFKNLSDPMFSIEGLMLSASLPLLLWLAPVIGVVYRKFRREG